MPIKIGSMGKSKPPKKQLSVINNEIMAIANKGKKTRMAIRFDDKEMIARKGNKVMETNLSGTKGTLTKTKPSGKVVKKEISPKRVQRNVNRVIRKAM